MIVGTFRNKWSKTSEKKNKKRCANRNWITSFQLTWDFVDCTGWLHSLACVANSREWYFHEQQRIDHPDNAVKMVMYCIELKCPVKYFSADIYRSITAWWTFCSRSIGHTVTACCIEAEKLCANSFIFEACRCATIATTLCVQRKQCARQWTSQCIIFMRSIVQTAGCVATLNSNK